MLCPYVVVLKNYVTNISCGTTIEIEGQITAANNEYANPKTIRGNNGVVHMKRVNVQNPKTADINNK